MHSGGEEVLLDVGGQDSTEAFEDVGHSDEAREILDGLLVGNLKRQVRLPSPHNSYTTLSLRQKQPCSTDSILYTPSSPSDITSGFRHVRNHSAHIPYIHMHHTEWDGIS